MKTKKSVASVLLLTLMIASMSSAFADDDRYEDDDDRGSRYERNDRDDDRNDRNDRNDDRYERNDRDDDDRGGRSDNDRDDDRGNGYNDSNTANDQVDQPRMTPSQKNERVKALKKAFAKKIGTRLDNFSQTKLETIIVIIDTKTLEIEADATMSDDKKDKLSVAYAAIRELINEKITSLSSTDGILDGLLN